LLRSQHRQSPCIHKQIESVKDPQIKKSFSTQYALPASGALHAALRTNVVEGADTCQPVSPRQHVQDENLALQRRKSALSPKRVFANSTGVE
ncbi:hypothetical protein, partial [Shimia sagamensis]|uniref:hypothetical protein n=1 Tax=Shimia sagamensis TaxID=1566352 RepID=UPI0024B7FA61